jgi:hypothetical protein
LSWRNYQGEHLANSNSEVIPEEDECPIRTLDDSSWLNPTMALLLLLLSTVIMTGVDTT